MVIIEVVIIMIMITIMVIYDGEVNGFNTEKTCNSTKKPCLPRCLIGNE